MLDGRGRQRRRRLHRSDPEGGERSAGGEPEQNPTQSVLPRPNDEPSTTMTKTMTTTKIKFIERKPNDERPSSQLIFPNRRASFLSLTSSTYIFVVLITIFLMVSGTTAAPPAHRQPTVEILDGYVNHSMGNQSFYDLARHAFNQLKGTPVEPRFENLYHLESAEKAVHRQRHHRKKNRKPMGKLKKIETDETGESVLEGRKHALMSLADPDGLRMTQQCDGQKFKQRIRVDGCLTKVVVNRLCHGTCSSIYIPRMHSKKLKAAFRSCAACAPVDYDFVDITLDCPGRNPPTATKTIVKVKSCKCREVTISSI